MSSFCWAERAALRKLMLPTFAFAASSADTVVALVTFITLAATLLVWQPAQYVPYAV